MSSASIDSSLCVLKPQVKLEPLIDRWYAWSHLFSPASWALNLAFRYLPIARSFVTAPAAHGAAAADPALFGGPFLDLPSAAVGAVQSYIARIERERRDELDFAHALREFSVRLSSATGHSLDSLRSELPSPLKGRIELAYDLNHQPRLRVLEEMFPESEFGGADSQETLIHLEQDSARPFFLSGLRVSHDPGLFVKAPFSSAASKMLYDARRIPVDLSQLSSDIGVSKQRLAPFFMQAPEVCRAAGARPENLRVRYFGHACILIETPQSTVLIDPSVAYDRGVDKALYTFDDFPHWIDVLILSHGHQDHFSPEVLMQLRGRVGVVAVPSNNSGEISDPSLKRILRLLGFETIITLDYFETINLKDGQITALPFTGEHCDLDIHSKMCALIEVAGRRIGVFVDSDAIDLDIYARIRERLTDCDIVFIGMECYGAPLSWLYGPLVFRPTPRAADDSRRLSAADCEHALALVDMINPKKVFVYAMGQEPWMKHIMGLNYRPDSVQLREVAKFIAECQRRGVAAAQLNEVGLLEL